MNDKDTSLNLTNRVGIIISTTKEQKELFTMYALCGFGSVVKYEGTLLELGYQDYAQHKHVPFIKYIPKGKRKPIGYIKGYKPFMIVLKGYNHPEPNSMFDKAIKQPNGLITSKSTYHSFDERYVTDFNNGFNEYLTLNKDLILIDVRS